jgi:hypothetical protein
MSGLYFDADAESLRKGAACSDEVSAGVLRGAILPPHQEGRAHTRRVEPIRDPDPRHGPSWARFLDQDAPACRSHARSRAAGSSRATPVVVSANCATSS